MSEVFSFRTGKTTKLALKRAMNNEPSIDELISNRKTVVHQMYNPETGESLLD